MPATTWCCCSVALVSAMGWRVAGWAWTRGPCTTVPLVAHGMSTRWCPLFAFSKAQSTHSALVLLPVATRRPRVARGAGLVLGSQKEGCGFIYMRACRQRTLSTFVGLVACSILISLMPCSIGPGGTACAGVAWLLVRGARSWTPTWCRCWKWPSPATALHSSVGGRQAQGRGQVAHLLASRAWYGAVVQPGLALYQKPGAA